MEEWRFLDTDYKDSAYNMALDEAIMISVKERKSLPTLRVFRWKPYTISIGYSQDINKTINLKLCKENNIGYVRRCTGGRAVLHADEITYSVVVNSELYDVGKNVTESYYIFSSALAHGLNLFGAPVELKKLNSPKEGPVKDNYLNPCFSSTAKYEVEYNGRKVIGSAQKRDRDIILQHGSIILNGDQAEILKYMPINDNLVFERMQEMIRKQTATLSEIKGTLVNYEDVIPYLVKGFEEKLNIKFTDFEINDYEKELLDDLIKNKYGNDEWNLFARKVANTK